MRDIILILILIKKILEIVNRNIIFLFMSEWTWLAKIVYKSMRHMHAYKLIFCVGPDVYMPRVTIEKPINRLLN